MSNKYTKQLLDTGLDTSKPGSKNLVQKEAEATGGLLVNKIADAVTKSHNDKIVKTKPAGEIFIPPEKREEMLNKLRQVLYKWNAIRYLNY